MIPDERLIEVVSALKAGGIDCLVMGGHAVRHYGVDRNTRDFDFVSDDLGAVRNAMRLCEHPVTFATLFPLAPDEAGISLRAPIDATHLELIRGVSFGSPKHVQGIGLVRRAYRRRAMDLDRRDKQAKLREQH